MHTVHVLSLNSGQFCLFVVHTLVGHALFIFRYGNICGFLDIEEAVSSSHFLRRYFRLDLGRKVLDYFMDNPQVNGYRN